MPGDLRDPEQYEPWHHDELYDHSPTPMHIPEDVDPVIQDVAWAALGHKLDKDVLEKIKGELAKQGYGGNHPGDESLRDKARELVRARKVASAWLNSKNR